MSDLQAKMGEVRMTVVVTRKETGKQETYQLVGKCTDEEAEQLGLKEPNDGTDTQ